jgi:hypothetical protein
VPLDRLLVIHTSRSADILWIGEQALRCAAIATVILPVRRLQAYAARRLQLAAEAGGGLGLLLRQATSDAARFVASRVEIAPAPDPSGCRRLRATVRRSQSGGARKTVEVDLDASVQQKDTRPLDRSVRAS